MITRKIERTGLEPAHSDRYIAPTFEAYTGLRFLDLLFGSTDKGPRGCIP